MTKTFPPSLPQEMQTSLLILMGGSLAPATFHKWGARQFIIDYSLSGTSSVVYCRNSSTTCVWHHLPLTKIQPILLFFMDGPDPAFFFKLAMRRQTYLPHLWGRYKSLCIRKALSLCATLHGKFPRRVTVKMGKKKQQLPQTCTSNWDQAFRRPINIASSGGHISSAICSPRTINHPCPVYLAAFFC